MERQRNPGAAFHRLSTSFVLGYRGCTKIVAERLLSGKRFKQSKNSYDWLGTGIYFWEANPARALEYVREAQVRKKLDANDVAVVGAVIDLGFCLDLLSSKSISLVLQAYRGFHSLVSMSGQTMPTNRGGSDLLLRDLDCAVLNYLHESRKEEREIGFDTVRGVFIEGSALYPGSGFFEKSHIQICVRRSIQIKGVFRVGKV
jgi:hypothetical protein